MSMSMPPWGGVPPPPPPGTQGTYNMPPNPTAYTPVQVRQSFNYTAPVPIPVPIPVPNYAPIPQPLNPPTMTTTEPVKKRKIDWPPNVRQYVQRAFDPANLDPEVSKSDLENKLRETISAATENETLFTIDWDNFPLPQQLIRAQRNSANLTWRNAPIPVPSAYQPFNHIPESRKRKSQEIDTPPWRGSVQPAFEDRITHPIPVPSSHFDQGAASPLSGTTSKSWKSQEKQEKRQRRFESSYKSHHQRSSPEPASGPVVGRSQKLEKPYFRLTSAPNPDQVRPEHVLKQTLDLLKRKWRKEGNYSYICDQFKSLRQDLTVQHIKNKFTVEVYEIHARIALEKGDLGEYNQCQTQLRALYALNLGGNPLEFKAYRVLYYIHTCNRTGLNDVLADLTPAEKEEPAIKHALDVRSALALGNYHRFFRLYLDTPNMGAYLMDMFVVRERLAALSNICKAYKPDVKLRFITEELGFESDADAAQFICEYQGESLLEERGDGIQFLTAKAGNIFETAKAGAFAKIDIKGQI